MDHHGETPCCRGHVVERASGGIGPAFNLGSWAARAGSAQGADGANRVTVIESKDEYYRLLRLVTAEAAWEAWILYILRGVEATAGRGTRVIAAINHVAADLRTDIRRETGTTNLDLLNALMEQPYLRINDVVGRCKVSRPTASKWLRRLEGDGPLASIRAGREVLFINRPLMAVLTGPDGGGS